MKALGVNPEFVDTSSGFHAGTLGVTDDFRVFMYQRAGEAIGQYDACELRMEDGQAFQLDVARTSGTSGNIIGVAHEDVPAEEYGWFQVYGPAQCRSSSISRGAEVRPSSTSGQLGTDTSVRPVEGLFITGGAGSLASISLSYPKIAAIATSGTGMSNVPDKPPTPDADTQYNLQITATGGASWEPDEAGTAPPPAADGVSPQPDDTDGAVGTETAYAREDHKHPLPAVATTSANGLMTAAQFDKLAGIANNATASDVPNVPSAELADVQYNLQVTSGGTATWEEDTGGGSGDASNADVTALQNEVDTLQHLTRDLHVRKILSDWSNVDDADADLFWATPINGAITLTDENFNNQGASITIPSSVSARTTYVFVRLPAATDATPLRIVQGSTGLTSNHWALAADEGVTVPDNDAFQYFMTFINPQETASLTFQLQERGEIETTRYDGSLGGESLIQAQNADRFAGLEHLTRDLHINTNNPNWENATDDLVDLYGVYTSAITTLTDANFDNNGAVILIASDAATTVFVRLPVAANYLRYRVLFPNGVARAGNAWTSVTGPDETTYQYWSAGSVDHPGGSITHAQFHEVELEDTIYTGSGSIPTGGARGEGLIKRTSDPYDADWGVVNEDRLAFLDHLTRDLHINADIPEWSDAADSDGDVLQLLDPGSAVTLTDANFNGKGSRVQIPDGQNADTLIYVRLPAASDRKTFRITFDGREPRGGNTWTSVTGPDTDTYQYWFVISVNNFGFSYVQLEKRNTLEETTYTGSGAIPAGGTAGQVLAKVTTDDYVTTWVDAASGGGGGGDFLELIGGSAAALALDSNTVADTGIDMPASIGDNEIWALRVGNERYDDLAFFHAKTIEDRNGTTVGAIVDPDSSAGLNAGVLIRGKRQGASQTDLLLLAKDTGTTGHILIAVTHQGLDAQPTLYRVTGGGGGGGDGGTDDAIARAAAAAAQMDANAAQNTADAALPKAGGTMTGALILHGAPTADLHPATKKYADNISAVALAALPRAGGNMTGALVLHDAPSADLQAATKKYVDDNDERLKDFATEPDVDDYELGEIVAVGESLRKLGTTSADTPNLYEATVGRDSIHLGSEHWRGVAGSQSPNGFTTDGGFSANPDNAIVMIMASDARHIRVIVKQSVFEQFKTSDFETTDKLHMTLALQSGDSDIVDMAYYNSYSRDTRYLIFQHQHASGNYNLYDEPAGNNMGATFRIDSNSGNQFAHEVSLKHWLLWPSEDPTAAGREALNLAEANAARLDAIDAQVDGSSMPLHTHTFDDTTALTAPTLGNDGDFAVSETFNNIEPDDLLVIDWTKCEHLNHHSEHVVPGSTTDAGREYLYPSNFNASEFDSEFIYAVDRAVQDNGAADTLNSWIVGSITYSGTNLTFGLHLQQGGTRANRNLKAQAGFSLTLRIYRNTTVQLATEGSLHAQVTKLNSAIGDLKFVVLTDAEYTALATKDDDTVYFTTAT